MCTIDYNIMDKCNEKGETINDTSYPIAYDIEAVAPVEKERRVSLNPAGFDVVNNATEATGRQQSVSDNSVYELHCCGWSDNDKNANNNSHNCSGSDIGRQKKCGGDNQRASLSETPSSTSFSFRKLWAFTGPGLWTSVAYLDPGSVQSDLQSGTVAKYQLLWVLLWSTAIGLLLQRLAIRLGIVSGLHFAEVCHKHFSTVPRLILWLLMEAAVLGAEIQGVIGSATAFYLLSNKSIPLWGGVVLAVGQSSILIQLEKYGMRKMEAVFALMIAVMAASFGYEYAKITPNQSELVSGILLPGCKNCDESAFLEGIGIVGAVIMPHNLFLHSTLVKSRPIDRSNHCQVKEANKYLFIESAISLAISFVINLLIVSVFATGMWNDKGTIRKSNTDILQICQSQGENRDSHHYTNLFANNSDIFEPNIYTGGTYLGCQYGNIAMYIWGIGILAAGQTNAMTATYTGQSIMEGFLNINWPLWKRSLITRPIVVLPPFLVAKFWEINSLSEMNDFINAAMSMLLPFALLPLISVTSNSDIMGKFKNGSVIKYFSCGLVILLIAINMYFASCFFADNVAKPIKWYAALGIITFGVLYISLCAHLLCSAVLSMGFSAWSKLAIANLMIVILVNIVILYLAYLVGF